MESKAVPEFLLKKSHSTARIDFWSKRKDSSPGMIGEQLKSKFVPIDLQDTKTMQSFYSMLRLPSEEQSGLQTAAVDPRHGHPCFSRQTVQVTGLKQDYKLRLTRKHGE